MSLAAHVSVRIVRSSIPMGRSALDERVQPGPRSAPSVAPPGRAFARLLRLTGHWVGLFRSPTGSPKRICVRRFASRYRCASRARRRERKDEAALCVCVPPPPARAPAPAPRANEQRQGTRPPALSGCLQPARRPRPTRLGLHPIEHWHETFSSGGVALWRDRLFPPGRRRRPVPPCGRRP